MAFIGSDFNMSKYISFKQIFQLVKMHLYVSIAATFMGLIMVSFSTGGITKYIFSGIFILIYMLVLYSKSADIAKHDRQEYSKEVPYAAKGFLLPIGIFVVGTLFYVLYSITWKCNIIDTTSGFVNNALFVVWTFVYTGLANLSNGHISLTAVIAFIIVPEIAAELGYFAGFKNFDLSEKVAEVVYDLDENKEYKKDD